MSEIRIRVGSEDVQLCGPGDRPLPVEMVEHEIENSRLRQSGGEPDRLPWRVHRCAHADAGRACGILRVFPGPKPSFDDEWVVSDTNREECQHGMKLATAVHVVALHNASISRVAPAPTTGGSDRSDAQVISECGDDAVKWARAFVATFEPIDHPRIDEATMVGWFANAIESRPKPASVEADKNLGDLRMAIRGAPRGGASGAAPAWIIRLHRAACAVAGIEVRESDTLERDKRSPGAHVYSREALLRMTDEALEAHGRMVRGLARAAAAYEVGEGGATLGGELWDDEMRSALALVRELGVAPPRSSYSRERASVEKETQPSTLVPVDVVMAWRRWAYDLIGDPRCGLDDDGALRSKIDAGRLKSGILPKAGPTYDQISAVVDSDAFSRAVVRDGIEFVAPKADDVVVDACARVAYDVYRVAFVGDDPMPEFDALDPERRLHVLRAARAAVSGTTPEAFHAEWTSELARDGWTAGPELSEGAKTHPNLVPYGDLPDEQHLLDGLFFAAATATLRELGRLEAQARLP